MIPKEPLEDILKQPFNRLLILIGHVEELSTMTTNLVGKEKLDSIIRQMKSITILDMEG